MAKILFLSHRVPFPPNKGEKIRAFHILNHLASRHQVWLGAGADDPSDLDWLDEARARFAGAFFGPIGRGAQLLNLGLGALSGQPLSVRRFWHSGLSRWVDQVLAEVKPDVVYVYSSAMAQYVADRLGPDVKLIIDFVDADAEKWRAYAGKARGPMRLVYASEFRRLVRFEARALQRADAALAISETERALLAGFHPQGADKLCIVPNGVDTDYFRPAEAQAPVPGLIVFCGTMDYLPNIDGAIWFAEEILPIVRERAPQARFRIVGARPAPQVLALAAREGVEVTGPVPDVRPHLAQASVVVAPLRIARGIQNKVLEGMAAARPMVSTADALDGINAEVGRDLLVGDDAAAFADAVLSILRGAAPADLGPRARAYVVGHHQWSEHLAGLDATIDRLTA